MNDPFDLIHSEDREKVRKYFDDRFVDLDASVEAQWRLMGPIDPPSPLFHYTTAGGLLGIIEKEAIFLTDGFFLNDQSELIYGRDLAIDVLRSELKGLSGNLAEFVDTAIRKFDPFDDPETGFRYYVASFCENGNLLSQWRAYGSPGSGVALGFAAEAIHRKQFAGDVPHAVLHRIEYSREKQTTLVRHVVGWCLRSLETDLTKIRTEFQRKIVMSSYFALMAMQLAGIFPQFKHPVFAEEHEWRLTVPRLPAEHRARILFREAGKNIVPYILFDLRVKTDTLSNRLPLIQVRHGPTAEPEVRKRSIETFLRERGYSEVKVSGSDIPLRVA